MVSVPPVDAPDSRPDAESAAVVVCGEAGEGEDLKQLRSLSGVDYLGLSETRITDTGLENLRGLTNLLFVNLSETPITDAGLIHRKGLANLEVLYLRQTLVTPEGVARICFASVRR